MTQLTTQIVTVTGPAITFTAAAASQTAECGQGVFVLVHNSDTDPHDLTINAPGTNLESGVAYPAKSYTIAAGTYKAIPLLPVYKNTADGLAHFTWSATTGMSSAIIKN